MTVGGSFWSECGCGVCAIRAISGMNSQSGLPVAMEPAGPHLRTSWFLKGGVSSDGEWPCWVRMRGRLVVWKWVHRVRMLGRAVLVMSRKMCCMSITRRAVVMVGGLGGLLGGWKKRCEEKKWRVFGSRPSDINSGTRCQENDGLSNRSTWQLEIPWQHTYIRYSYSNCYNNYYLYLSCFSIIFSYSV